MLDSRLVKPPVLNLIRESKNFGKKSYNLDAVQSLIPDESMLCERLVKKVSKSQQDRNLKDKNIEINILVLDIVGILSPQSKIMNAIAQKNEDD